MKVNEIFQKLNSVDSKAILAWLKTVDRKTWFLVSGGVLIVASAYIFLIEPAWFQRPILKKKIVEVETQTIRLKVLLPRKPELQEQKEETKIFISEFQKRLFKEEEMAFLLGRISLLAQDAQVEVLSSKPMEQSESFPAPYSDKYKKFIYLISVEGGYHQIADLVSRLESNPQYFQIQSLSIAAQGNNADRQIADITVMAVSHAGEVNGK
ncbi:MAG TPA: type 4a pilus biogenesis protein PilO [Candidatus Omnitrophota bacterium]|nr:type 4a pilus biogenesis protein PilO [Candidatus Omnitrophota bacterium]